MFRNIFSFFRFVFKWFIERVYAVFLLYEGYCLFPFHRVAEQWPRLHIRRRLSHITIRNCLCKRRHNRSFPCVQDFCFVCLKALRIPVREVRPYDL